MIYYLKAPSREALLSALADEGMMLDETTPQETGEFYALDIIGAIHAPTGRTLTSDDGEEYEERAPLDGFFANIMMMGDAPLPEALRPFESAPPTHPVRVFG
mgnify:CR=1 FL=1